MNPDIFYTRIVAPTLDYMAASPSINVPVSASARVLVMAIAGQESRWAARRQVGLQEYYPQKVGARGYWQCESTWGGPVAINDVLQKTPVQIAAACKALDISCDAHALYEACAWNDTIACIMARLKLWSDPAPLPDYWDKGESWKYYLRNWQPGAPHPESWSGLHDQAMAAVGLPPK